MTRDPSNFREYAGALCAFIIVMAFVAIGFVVMAIVVTTGTSVTVPGDWMAAMLSLASAALGFLIGKQTTSPNTATVTVPVGDTVTTATKVTSTAE